MNEVFLDASYAIALSAPRDYFHKLALELSEKLQRERSKLITTRAVVLEIGNSLAKFRYRNEAVKLLKSLEDDPNVETLPLSEELYFKALQLYQERLDKEWGITDCISFVVMQDRGLIEALTTDQHFEQAGFRILLRK